MADKLPSLEMSDDDNDVMMMVDLPQRPRSVVSINQQMYPESESVLSSSHVPQNPKQTVNERGITGQIQMRRLRNSDDSILQSAFEFSLPTPLQGSSDSTLMRIWSAIHLCITLSLVFAVLFMFIGALVFIIMF